MLNRYPLKKNKNIKSNFFTRKTSNRIRSHDQHGGHLTRAQWTAKNRMYRSHMPLNRCVCSVPSVSSIANLTPSCAPIILDALNLGRLCVCMCVLCVRECVCVYVCDPCDASIVRCVHVEVAWTSFVIFVCFFFPFLTFLNSIIL